MDVNRVTEDPVANLSIMVGLSESTSPMCHQLLTSHNLNWMGLFAILTVKKLGKKIRDHDLVLTKSDKGNTVVLAERDDYDQKVSDFLSDSKCNVSSVNSDFNFHQHVGRASNLLIKNPDAILESNPVPPSMYGFLKLYNDGMPIGPVVPYVSAPTYKLSKFVIVGAVPLFNSNLWILL